MSFSGFSLDRSNTTMEHQLNANCLRKCAYWNLNIKTNSNRVHQMHISKNSGIALKQMNYQIDPNLTPEQIKQKKESLKMPESLFSFKEDTIDEMMEKENRMIISMLGPDHHAQ